VSDALAGCAVVAALRGGVLDGRLDDLDCRKEDPVTGDLMIIIGKDFDPSKFGTTAPTRR